VGLNFRKGQMKRSAGLLSLAINKAFFKALFIWDHRLLKNIDIARSKAVNKNPSHLLVLRIFTAKQPLISKTEKEKACFTAQSTPNS